MAETEKQKRRLKVAPPQTIRERAEKAQVQAGKTPRGEKIRGAKVFGPFKTIGRGLRKASRYIIPPYFRNSWHELRLVTWPNRTQTRRLTIAVLIFAIIFGLLVAAVDYVLDKVFKQLLLG